MEEFGMSAICVKCKNRLTDKEKEIGLPLCQDCVDSLTDSVKKKMRGFEEKEIEDNVDNFSKFILSSGRLFRLDSMEVIQCCFNIFMTGTKQLEDRNLDISEKIFKDAIEFIETELDNIEEEKVRSEKNPSNRIFSIIDKIIKEGAKSGNGSKDDIVEDRDDKAENRTEDKAENRTEDKVEKRTEDKAEKDRHSKKRIGID